MSASPRRGQGLEARLLAIEDDLAELFRQGRFRFTDAGQPVVEGGEGTGSPGGGSGSGGGGGGETVISGVEVLEGGTSLGSGFAGLNFGAGFDVTETPAGQANVLPDFSEVALSGSLSTPAQITSDQNDYALHATALLHRLSTDASRTITGFVAPTVNRLVVLRNVGAQNLVLANENVGSAAANQIVTGTGADIALAPADTAILIYDLTAARWAVLV